MPDMFIIIFAIITLGLIIQIVVFTTLIKPWRRALLHGFPIPFLSVVLMRTRGTPSTLLVDAYIDLRHQSVEIKITQVEIAYLKNKNQISTSDDLVNLVKEQMESGQLSNQL